MLKRIRTRSLEIAFEESGRPDAPAAVLLHGFPYDVRAYDAVAAHLAPHCRVLVPYLRGFGPTRFLSPEVMRSGQQAALGVDLLGFLDALKVERAIVGGYDWGGRAACIASALWPERVRGLISVGGYNVQAIAQDRDPAVLIFVILLPNASQLCWQARREAVLWFGRVGNLRPGHIGGFWVGLEHRPAGIEIDLHRSHGDRFVENGPGLEWKRPAFASVNGGDCVPLGVESISGGARIPKMEGNCATLGCLHPGIGKGFTLAEQFALVSEVKDEEAFATCNQLVIGREPRLRRAGVIGP